MKHTLIAVQKRTRVITPLLMRSMKLPLLCGLLGIGSLLNIYGTNVIIAPTGGDDATLIQSSLDALEAGDTLTLEGDFVFGKTIYLPSDFTWILDGTLTLTADADLDRAGYVAPGIDARRRTAITEKTGGATNINMSGGTYYGNSGAYPYSMRFLNFASVTHSRFHDMHITEVTDDNFTLGPGCNNNECRNLRGSYSLTGNAMTDKGDHNLWVDCIAEYCLGKDGDGWTPKCRYSTFIRCIAANNGGPGFGIYAREEGYDNNEDVGAHIIGNKFIDCVSYGSANSSGFSFNISSNCPGAIIRDNYIQAVCYDNYGSGVYFRNKDDAELGIIENNIVEIVSYGNKGLNSSGSNNSWAGGLGMENDNSTVHNLIQNITGSVICFDNSTDVNTRGGTNCNITVYHPEGVRDPVLDDKSSGNNTVTVIGFKCSDTLEQWCQVKYCDEIRPPMPEAPSGLTVDVVSSGQIDLSWTDNSEVEDGFSLEQKTVDSYVEIAVIDKNNTSYSVTDLAENTAYSFRIRTFNIAGYSAYSNEVSGTTETSVNTMERVTPGSIIHAVFPNPFQENAHIRYSLAEGAFVTIHIYDPSGREINLLAHEQQASGTHTYIFNGSNLPCGIYYYAILTGDAFASGEIIRRK